MVREVGIRCKGASKLNAVIYVDGRRVNMKKNEFGTYEAKVHTEKDKIEVAIVKYLEINSPLWFLMSLLFYIISIFGILDLRQDKNCIVMDCKFICAVTKEKNNIEFSINALKSQAKAVSVTSEENVEEISNVCYIDKKAKRRLKIMKWVKLIIFVATVVGLVFLVKKHF